VKYTVGCRMPPVRPPMRPPMTFNSGLLGTRPPMHEPRISGPLLRAPCNLLPAPLRMERGLPPPSSPPPARPVMHMPPPVGFRRDPSPPKFVAADFVRKFVSVFDFNEIFFRHCPRVKSRSFYLSGTGLLR